ncbi:MAG: M1 family metallopeptidase [Gemmatimonadaceae bacterium]|nr:M1 family metallopeptidase [Gemmatimonadaceae bacterium]
MRSALVIRFLLAASCLASSVAVAQPPASRTGASRRGIDVMQYVFRVEFPRTGFPDTVRFSAATTARRAPGIDALWLDLAAAMQVDSVHLGVARVPFTRSGDSVRVALPGAGGDTISVTVHYRGTPTDGLIIRRDPALGWTAFGDNFPDRARQWLAVVDHPSDKALVAWDVVAPATHRVIANGALLEETPLAAADGGVRMVRTRWRTERPIYTAVMVIGVAPFAVLELGPTACGLAELPGCVAQSVWTTPAQRSTVPGSFERAGEIVALFARLAGPFPYEKLAHVSSSTRYGGMENAGAIFYASPLFRPGSPGESLIAHETAHQWFGDAVTEREWPDVWLSEGFATYFAALWTEHAHGQADFRSELARMREQVLRAPVTASTPVINEELSDLRNVLNSNVYQKAGFVLHMLRREIGDSSFFRAIRAHYVAHRHANSSTAELQAAFEAEAGRPLDWFFTQWLRRPGFAEVTPGWSWDAARRTVVVTVAQGTRFAPYRLSLSVDVTDADGQVRRVRLAVPAQATATLDVPGPFSAPPRRVEFDPDVSILGVVSAPPARPATPGRGRR